MPVVKVIEVLAQSEKGWEDAAAVAVREVSKTVHNVRSVYVEDLHAKVKDGHIILYRLNARVSFEVEPHEGHK